MQKLTGMALLLAVVALVPAESVGQRRAAARPATTTRHTQFAAELNWSSDYDFGIGARAIFPLASMFPRTPLDGIVSFDYFFPSAPAGASAHYWEINGDVAYRFTVPRSSSLAPYGGGGLNIAHASGSVTTPTGTVSNSVTKVGLNLLGGTTFKVRASVTPFLEARGEIGGGKTFVLTGGVRF
jgi:opacity protein-like surface antigen